MPPGPYQAKKATKINESASPKNVPARVFPNQVGWRLDGLVMNYPFLCSRLIKGISINISMMLKMMKNTAAVVDSCLKARINAQTVNVIESNRHCFLIGFFKNRCCFLVQYKILTAKKISKVTVKMSMRL